MKKVCRNCGRPDCPQIGLSKFCRDTPDAERWTEPDDQGHRECRHCLAQWAARQDCAAHSVDWFGRCQLLEGAASADAARNLAATERVGLPPFDCDTPEHLADEILELRTQLATARLLLKHADRIVAFLAVERPAK